MMYEHYSVPDSGVQSVIVPNAAVLFQQGNISNNLSSLTVPTTRTALDANSTSEGVLDHPNSQSSSQHMALHMQQQQQQQPIHHNPEHFHESVRRKSDSDVQQASSVSPPLSHVSQPVSPTCNIRHGVAAVHIQDGPQQEGSSSVSSREVPVCRVTHLHSNPADIIPSTSSLANMTSAVPMGGSGSGIHGTSEGRILVEEGSKYIKEENSPSVGAVRGRPRASVTPVPQCPCMICGDRSTGKHYGAYSCDGCKGFFRRSIRKNHAYTCRFKRECNVTKDRRNQCRFCRFRKCVNAGMRKDAVQNERDRICHRRSVGGEGVALSPSEGCLTVDILVSAEQRCRQMVPSSDEQRLDSERRIASVSDVSQSVKQQLLVLVEWAKAIPCFQSLVLEDRIKLLKAHSGEHLLLGIAWRSLNTEAYLLLGNDKLIPRLEQGVQVPHCKLTNREITAAEVALGNINWIASRVLDDVVQPLQLNHVDEKEFMCLRTMIFFDPMLHGLADRPAIHSIRLQAQLLLEDYISERQDVDARGRFGQIMFMLPYLQSIATAMIQQIQMAKKDGFPEVDVLISEMLLGYDKELVYPPMSVTHLMDPPPPTHGDNTESPARVEDVDSLTLASDKGGCGATSLLTEPCDLSHHQANHHHLSPHQHHPHHQHEQHSHQYQAVQQHQTQHSESQAGCSDSIELSNDTDQPSGNDTLQENSRSHFNPYNQAKDDEVDRVMEHSGTLDYSGNVHRARSIDCSGLLDHPGTAGRSKSYEFLGSLECSSISHTPYADASPQQATSDRSRTSERNENQSIDLDLTNDFNRCRGSTYLAVGQVRSPVSPDRCVCLACHSAHSVDSSCAASVLDPPSMEPCDLSPYSNYSCSSSEEVSPAVQVQPLDLQQQVSD